MSVVTAQQLKTDTPLHRKLTEAVRQRLRLSQDFMSRRYANMAENEELFSAYIKEKEVDKMRRSDKKNFGEMDYTTIEVPYSYATALTAHTYYTSVFLGRNPVWQFAGRHGEAENKIQGVEAVMDYQLNVGQMLMPLFIWILDPLKYGFGVVGHYWDEEIISVTKKQMVAPDFMGIPVPYSKPREEYVVEHTKGYVGNRLYNVRPQDFFPDPRVPMWNLQAGEFTARYVEIPISELRAGELSGRYVNVREALSKAKGAGSGSSTDIPRDTGGRQDQDLPGDSSEYITVNAPDDQPIGLLKCHEMYLRLSPKEWKFHDSNNMEIWVITRSTDGVLIGCKPLGDASNKFPFDIIEHEPNGYNFFSRSMMEIAKPMNDVLTWLFNSHFYNVRAALNNMFVIDPSMVNVEDAENRGPGKMFRLKPAAYGRGVDLGIKQFNVQDVTRSHVADSQVVIDMIQRVFGVTDNVMGLVNAGGRKTATEVRTSTSLAANRLKTQCEMMSAMGFGPFAQKLLQRTQANLDVNRQYRIVGDQIAFSGQFVQVDNESIGGFFDFVPVDGTLPIDRFAQSAVWQQLLGQVAQIPQVFMQYDLGKIFAWVATLAGIKNIQQFRVQVTPDEQLMQQAQAGNVVPMKGPRDPNSTPNPQQIPGTGTAL